MNASTSIDPKKTAAQLFAPNGGPINRMRMAFLGSIASKMSYGTLTVHLPDGRSGSFGSFSHSEPRAELRINDMAIVRRYLRHGALGFAEGYIAGEIETPDLAGLLELFDRNMASLDNYYGSLASRFWRAFMHRRNANTKLGSRRNIRAHYDLGNDFFAAWLDPGMTYSAALFADDDTVLAEAQDAKYDHLCRLLELQPEHRLLEIGCGWGGFASHAARRYGARIDCVTISRAQHDYARQRIFEEGLSERVNIQLKDYRELEGRYERIASIEMFEAVGERFWPTYFGKLRGCLSPGGRVGLQIITIDDRYFESYRRGADFIQQYIFPGGMLPSPSALRGQLAAAGLEAQSWFRFGRDYARTLAIWSERFHAAFDDLRPLGFDERFKRIWHYYLAYCEAGFRSGSTDVVQLTAAPA